jgi:hypothetical protein
VQGLRRVVIDHARHDAPPVLAPAWWGLPV